MLDAGRSKAQLLLKNIALSATAEGVTISDCRQHDNPLIYANDGFERLTGYPIDDVIGRNCRFLQEPGTDRETVIELRSAIAEGRQCTVQLLNYRKDGTVDLVASDWVIRRRHSKIQIQATWVPR